jgi:hypothetical protein
MDLRINGEIFVGNSLNVLINRGKNFIAFDVDSWISYGDPFELDIYNFWEGIFLGVN